MSLQEEVVREIQTTSKFTWTIENFSTKKNNKKLYSDTFVVDGYKWCVLIFPKGNKVDYLSIYLAVADSSALPSGWSQHAHFSLAVVNQNNKKLTITKDTQHEFFASESDWGFTSFMPVSDLYDPSYGFLMNDTLIIQAEVTEKKTEVHTPSEKQAETVKYDENLVGSRIKILWPEDETYHHGVIKSFNCIRKKHKLLYDDGEEELVNLETEKWDLVENVSPASDSDYIKPPPPEKVSSPQSDIICVQGYNVMNNIAPILEAIFKKHGDIAANCSYQIASVRTSFLEIVCDVVRRIQTDDITTIVSDMKEIEFQVSEVEAANIDVSWIRAYLADIAKTRKEAMENSTLLTEMKANIIFAKTAAQMDLKESREALIAAQERFQQDERCVKVLELVEQKLSNNILESKAEKDSWVKQPIL